MTTVPGGTTAAGGAAEEPEAVAPLAVRADAPEVLELPPAHLELAWRPLTPADAPALHTLLQAIETVDQSPQRTSEPEVVDLLEGDWKDLSTDSIAGFDDSGTMRAYALVEVRPGDRRTVRAFLRGGVHPVWRSRGVGRAVLAWMEGRGRQMLAESGKDLPARLAVYVDEHMRDQRRLYAAAGFSPIRWYIHMRRDLRAPLPTVREPEGIHVGPWAPSLDEAVRLAHNEAFLDHWGSEPQTAQTWQQHRNHFAPEWSFVAVDTAGGREQVAGYALSGRYEHDWPVLGYTCGYTDLLGVRPAWRGRRLSVSLLARVMEAYRDAGMQYATLLVDTANPSGAHGLYERLGYEATHGEVLYSVEI
ncbi:GNAT family N-acetyltransferase [Cellulomonas carbonis]|uniref:GNAT family acetyltransferase n=1 Tax=Cellulomonas carbonis T26 TaxID=947969 RepID=A0A0A0BXE0_9CELL|nr:GNAT family N-acetyltransferase [Cellulomonas carbonis]KGM12586.1 GNAT family acetyltransferase [Cellulomonas carbonis T26]GGB93243.1 putative acetyltransferase, GNAT [Cellulomonas carbonis]